MKRQSLSIQDSVVAEFRTSAMPESLKNWRTKHKVPFAESCERQIWYADSDTFFTFPVKDLPDQSCTLLHGADGYAFLMRLNLGLLSQKIGEVNIKGQFYVGWQQMNAAYPERARYYGQFVQSIVADTRLISANIMSDLKSPNPVLVARDLIGQRENEAVLIIGQTSNGQVAKRTDLMGRACSSNTSSKASHVAVMGENERETDILFDHFMALSESGGCIPSVEKIYPENIDQAFELYDRVYWVRPFRESVFDRSLVTAWRQRQRRDNAMIQLELDDSQILMSDSSSGSIPGFVSAGQVKQELNLRELQKIGVIDRASKAVDAVTRLRMDGIQPSKRLLATQVPDLFYS